MEKRGHNSGHGMVMSVREWRGQYMERAGGMHAPGVRSLVVRAGCSNLSSCVATVGDSHGT
eukprot:3169499-Pyramimonas_sp.AAC.1